MEIVIICYLISFAALTAVIIFLLYRIRSLKEPHPEGKEEEASVIDGYGILSKGDGIASRRERVLSDSPGSRDEYDELISRLELIFETEKIYLQPEIRITAVADMLHTSKNNVSKAIKMKTGKNFCQLVHSYRVREAMRLYAANPRLTISQLYNSVGFNSKTTFNTAFGRNTGCTPAEWCKNYRKNSEQTGKNGYKKTKR